SGHAAPGRMIRGEADFTRTSLGRSATLDEHTLVSFGNSADLERDRPFTIAIWLRPSIGNAALRPLVRIADARTRRGYEMSLENHTFIAIQRRATPITFRMISAWPDNALEIRGTQLVPTSDWSHVTLTYDGSGKAAGLKLWINGQPDQVHVLRDNLTGSIRNDAELLCGDKTTGKSYNGGIDDLRVYNRALNATEIAQLGVHHPVQAILSGVYGKRAPEETAALKTAFLKHYGPPEIRRAYTELNQLKKDKVAYEKTLLNTMVMSEQEKPRETFVLGRGDYRNKTDKVMPGVPAVLPPMPPPATDASGKPGAYTRLDLAKWLVSPGHPLTARVMSNRFWQMYFGLGIVKTSEDFGSQGEPPVHAELLDWLATEFIRTGWDVRAMQKLLVMSATYRQTSRVTPALREKDPENRLLARGPRFRLPAEMVRDNALAAGGLLDTRIGGPSVLPYHPKGLWEEMAFGDGFTRQTYEQDHGADLYRRTMYTFWKRTVPPPTLVTFDAPDREKCVVRRAITNTPLQALILLNDPTYVEAARALATRTLGQSARDSGVRLAYAFRAATARRPAARELTLLRQLLAQQTAIYQADANAAAALLKVGESPADTSLAPAELAAWTMVCSAILNLDEVMTKE
ncbi:MAG: DUF1553 domain-containing protein, partial [Blastocatellia bacterium]